MALRTHYIFFHIFTLVALLSSTVSANAQVVTASEFACQIGVSYLEGTSNKFVIPIGENNVVSFDVLNYGKDALGGTIDMFAFPVGAGVQYGVSLRNLNYQMLVGGRGLAPKNYNGKELINISFEGEQGIRLNCTIK